MVLSTEKELTSSKLLVLFISSIIFVFNFVIITEYSVMDMQFSTRKRRRKKFEPRVRVRKLKEEKTCEEYQSMVKDKVAEAEWNCTDVNEHCQQMKNIMMDTAQVTCGLTKVHVGIRKHGGGMRKLLKQ